MSWVWGDGGRPLADGGSVVEYGRYVGTASRAERRDAVRSTGRLWRQKEDLLRARGEQ